MKYEIEEIDMVAWDILFAIIGLCIGIGIGYIIGRWG
jgi:membrane protein DedA with SNARE-associated domain